LRAARARARPLDKPAPNQPSNQMGLLSIIRKVKRKEREMRVLMVGLDNAGKTTVVRRLKEGAGADNDNISPTLGFSICSLSRRGRKLNVWDVGGQRSLRPYWRNYFERTDGLVWVVDSSDLARLRDAADELRRLLGEERLAGATLLILANKQDVAGALGLDEISRALGLVVGGGGSAEGEGAEEENREAGDAATAAAAAASPSSSPSSSSTSGALVGAIGKRRHWRVAACSARTGQGLEEAFDWIVDDVASRIYMFDD
jgi:ADP-ribosylation factor-like protein 2